MAKKLYGTDPDQVPTNADLGTIAYQDSKNTVLENAYINAKGADGLEMGRDYTSPNNSSRLFFNSNVSGGNWTIFNNSGTLKMQSGAEAGSTSGNYTAFTLTTTNAVFGANAVFSSGYGIDFGAVSGGNSTSTLLDDYEEGTWTPTFAFSGGGSVSTSTVTEGYYVKVGKMVQISFQIATSGLSSPSGDTYINGLPFAASNQSDNRSGFAIGFAMRWGTDFTNLRVGMIDTEQRLRLFKNSTTATSSSFVQGSDFNGGTNQNYMYVSGTYQTN